MIRPVAFTEAHMECRFLSETLPVLCELLAFEKIAERPGEAVLKHPNTAWRLVVHEGGAGAPPKQMHNHFGVRVENPKEVDAAFAYLQAHKERYGLKQIGQPGYSHGSYSLYFVEPGTNGWEIECYEAVLRKEREWSRLGGVRAPHWRSPWPAERFPGRGYVPQGFTHGTLACGDVERSAEFYANVLGLEVYRANERVVYVKCPETPSYVVCAERPSWKQFSPAFRFTTAVSSNEEVAAAHRALAARGAESGVTELGELEWRDGAAAFLLRDLDRNWWEIATRS